jgi:hypothetical protein
MPSGPSTATAVTANPSSWRPVIAQAIEPAEQHGDKTVAFPSISTGV